MEYIKYLYITHWFYLFFILRLNVSVMRSKPDNLIVEDQGTMMMWDWNN